MILRRRSYTFIFWLSTTSLLGLFLVRLTTYLAAQWLGVVAALQYETISHWAGSDC